MKKIVALVLALMMVLSLGVSALALTLTEIKLDQVEVTEDGAKLIKQTQGMVVSLLHNVDNVCHMRGEGG